MREYAQTIDAMFFETSSKEDENIFPLYDYICLESEKLKLKDDMNQIELNKKENNSTHCSC